MIRRVLVILVLLVATPAFADWYDDYNAGIDAAKKQNWDVVIQKMSNAIRQKPNEGRERPHGTIFVEYRPYYYRGVAYFQKGDYENAIKDLRKTKGPGELKLADAGSLVDRAEQKLKPPDTETTTTIVDRPPDRQPDRTPDRQPDLPAVDAATRDNARQLLAQARNKRIEAVRARAETYAGERFTAANDKLTEASTRAEGANTTADWVAVRDAANRAIDIFETSISDAQLEIARDRDKPGKGAQDALAELRRQVKDALEHYFDGDFTAAAQKLDRIVKGDQQNNAMLWAFLGAAHYYNFYLDGTNHRDAEEKARAAFKKARSIKPNLRLNQEYFQTRVRKFYSNLQG